MAVLCYQHLKCHSVKFKSLHFLSQALLLELITIPLQHISASQHQYQNWPIIHCVWMLTCFWVVLVRILLDVQHSNHLTLFQLLDRLNYCCRLWFSSLVLTSSIILPSHRDWWVIAINSVLVLQHPIFFTLVPVLQVLPEACHFHLPFCPLHLSSHLSQQPQSLWRKLWNHFGRLSNRVPWPLHVHSKNITPLLKTRHLMALVCLLSHLWSYNWLTW